MKNFNTFKSIISLITILIGMSFTSLAQDIIVLNDGSLEKAKILEINENDITYKKWDKQDGPTYTISKSRVLSINYQDGSKENFADQQQNNYNNQQNNYYQRPQKQPKQPKQPREKKIRPELPKRGFSAHFGLNLPIGAFGYNSSAVYCLSIHEKDGFCGDAGVGVNLGIKWRKSFSKRFGLFVMGDFIYNGLNSDIKKLLNNGVSDITGTKYYSSKVPSYLNIPVLAGLNYTYRRSSGWGFWGELALGVDFRMITDFELKTTDNYSYSTTMSSTTIENESFEYDNAVSFAFQTGLGIIFNDTYSLGLHFYGMGMSSRIEGNYKYDYHHHSSTYNNHNYTEDKSGSERFSNEPLFMDMLILRLGYHF